MLHPLRAWWNGRHTRLKICWAYARGGSSPPARTSCSNIYAKTNYLIQFLLTLVSLRTPWDVKRNTMHWRFSQKYLAAPFVVIVGNVSGVRCFASFDVWFAY